MDQPENVQIERDELRSLARRAGIADQICQRIHRKHGCGIDTLSPAAVREVTDEMLPIIIERLMR